MQLNVALVFLCLFCVQYILLWMCVFFLVFSLVLQFCQEMVGKNVSKMAYFVSGGV